MKVVFITILIFTVAVLRAQSVQTNHNFSENKKDLTDQVGYEDSLSKKFFDENYSRQNFEKYGSSILIGGDTVQYADKYFLVWIPAKFKKIFSSGIIYPAIIVGEGKRYYKLTITNFEELPFLSNTPTQKRFRFWLYGKGEVNPTVCFIELTNPKATSRTDMDSFIKGAMLTFYKSGWFII